MRISAGICSGFLTTDHSTLPRAMPPSGCIATRAAGGSTCAASSEMIRRPANFESVNFGDGRLVSGKGASTDTVEASVRAYLNAVNRTLFKTTAR